MPPVDQPTILLAVVDPRTRAGLKDALRREGYRVLAAANALEALLVGARQKGRIDLLVTAPDMAGIDGRKLAEKFRQPFPAVAVVFLDGEPAEAALERIRQALSPARKPPSAEAPLRAKMAG
jgi:CheY-like chemotaxis protein